MMLKRQIAVATLLLATFAGSTHAADWERAPGVWADTLRVYTFTRGNDEIRFGFENISNREIHIGAIDVEYQCNDGSRAYETHYVSHRYPPGEKHGYVGFDSVCENSGGFSSWTITDCSSAGGSCF